MIQFLSKEPETHPLIKPVGRWTSGLVALAPEPPRTQNHHCLLSSAMQSRPSGRVSLPGNDGPNNAKGGSKDPNNQSPRAAHGSQPSQSVSSQGRQMLIEPMSACEPFGDLGAGIDGEGGGESQIILPQASTHHAAIRLNTATQHLRTYYVTWSSRWTVVFRRRFQRYSLRMSSAICLRRPIQVRCFCTNAQVVLTATRR